MGNRRTVFSMGFLLVVAATFAGQAVKPESWSGVVTDNICGAKNASGAGAAACAKQCVAKKGAKLAIYDPASKQVYLLDPQEKLAGHEGRNVTIQGTLDKATKTIHVSSVMDRTSAGM